MKTLDTYITEKFKITKDTKIYSDKELEIIKEFEDEESLTTLKFILNFIKRSRSGPWSESIFHYWYMSIKKDTVSCEHIGWSHGGWGKIKYVETVIKNYNNDRGTHIKSNMAGTIADAGIPIFCIQEVVDALQSKFTNVNLDEDKPLCDKKLPVVKIGIYDKK